MDKYNRRLSAEGARQSLAGRDLPTAGSLRDRRTLKGATEMSEYARNTGRENHALENRTRSDRGIRSDFWPG